MPITEGIIADGAPNHHITLKSNTTLTYDLFMLIVYVTAETRHYFLCCCLSIYCSANIILMTLPQVLTCLLRWHKCTYN